MHRNFSANIGISFHTPEEYFLNEPIEPFTRDFEPGDHLRDDPQQTKGEVLKLDVDRAQDLMLDQSFPSKRVIPLTLSSSVEARDAGNQHSIGRS